MAFKEFRTRSERRDPAPETQAKPATTYIDAGCELSGKLRFREAVRVDGSITGQIEGEDTVIIGESGRIQATIRSESVVIYGTVEGDITAKREITLHKSAHVTGDMRTSGIVIEQGAKVKGHIAIGEEEASAAKSSGAKKDRASAESEAAGERKKSGSRPVPVA